MKKIELSKLYNEDCMKNMSRVDDNFVDLTVTSPPYDDMRDYNEYNFDYNRIDNSIYLELLE